MCQIILREAGVTLLHRKAYTMKRSTTFDKNAPTESEIYNQTTGEISLTAISPSLLYNTRHEVRKLSVSLV